LKKQSQCQNRQYGINSVIVRIYRDFSYFERFLAVKNKAKQSQMPAFGWKSEARIPKSEIRQKRLKPGVK